MKQKNQFGQIIGNEITNWNPRDKPAAINMNGNYCILEPLDMKLHSVQLYDSLQFDNQGESWTYLPYGPFATYQDFQAWILASISSGDVFFAILDAKNKLPIGICSYLNIQPQHGTIEVGHLHFSKLLKRTPAATEAMFLMMQYAFDILGYRRYEWKCNDLNEPSRLAAMRLGFKFEGIFRQHNVFKNHNRDTAWYSIIDNEWPRLKEKFLAWLDPNNFDVHGNQLRKLQEI